jgi:hypothetical protein
MRACNQIAPMPAARQRGFAATQHRSAPHGNRHVRRPLSKRDQVEAIMAIQKLAVLAALAGLAATSALPTPVQAQDPTRMLGPLGAPFRMIFRGIPDRKSVV